jgi:hypothetical protein
VKPTEHPTKTAKATTPLFALLCAPLRGKGTGAGGRALNLLLLALTALALTATPALAGSSHIYSHPIGSGRGEGAGQLELTAPVLFDTPSFSGTPHFNVAGSGVAVNDATHDVYVADTGNRRVDEFEADGTFIRTFGKDVNKTKELSGTGKKEEEEKDVCDPQTEPAVVCQKGAVGSEPGALEAPRFVAVDNSTTSASKGDVYVGTGVGKEAEDELQYIKFPGATGGTYTLSFEGETTGPIAFTLPFGNAVGGPNAVAAKEALEKLPKLKGNIFVAESPGHGGYLEIEFRGSLTETAVPLLGCDSSELAPAPVTCEVSVGRPGSHLIGEIISKFSSGGTLQAGWGTGGQLDGSTASEGPFGGELNGIAVDTAGDLWVADGTARLNKEVVYEFEQEGKFKENLQRVGVQPSAGGIAVDAPGEIYYAGTGYPPGAASGIALDTGENEVYEDFGTSIESASGSFTSPELEAGGGAGLAVDSSVGTAISSGTVYATNASSDRVEAFGIALGVNPSGPGSATQVTASAATLNGVIDPENLPVTECYFEYGETDEYGQSVPCEQGLGENPGEIGKGTSPVPVSAKLSGLHGGVAYHYRLVARNANGIVEGADEAFATPTVPVVTGGEAVNVTEGGAELRADVNPEGLQVSRCTFEYGTSAAYGARESCQQRKSEIGFGTAPVPVSAQISGLAPNTTYYWRLRVEDVHGEAFEPGHTFVYPTAGAGLPDNRAYEMVTPPFKNGASVGLGFGGPGYMIADNGSRVIDESIQCFAGSPSCDADRFGTGEPFQFTRTSSGWVTTPLAPPASEFRENTPWAEGTEGADLFSMPTGPAGEDEWYKREENGSFVAIGPANPPENEGEGDQRFDHNPRAGTADLSHFVWTTIAPFWPFDHTNPEKTVPRASLYEYLGTGNREPLLVGVNDKGEQLGTCGTTLGFTSPESGTSSDQGALSTDGRTVYFTACESELYARVDGGEPEAHTVKISAPQCEDSECRSHEARASTAVFESASEDGSRAYFLDTQQLTDRATQGSGSDAGGGKCHEGAGDCNLYLSECTADCEGAGEQRTLIDASAVPAGDTRGPEVQGVFAASADGSHVYFVANGVLTSVANDQGAKASLGHCVYRTGTCNLYVYERDARYPDGHVAFVTSLPGSGADGGEWNGLANVTPDGRFLVFEDNGQIFRYDAESERLQRVSVGEDGFNDDGNAGSGEATIVKVEDLGRALSSLGPQRRDPTMSDDGSRVFFESPIALTAHALDDVVVGHLEPEPTKRPGYTVPIYAENVYEWEQEGVGSCPAGQSSGCTYLISDGHDVSNSEGPCKTRHGSALGSATCLMGTDRTGENVFFTTADRLVPADTDTQTDIYDARICEPEHDNPCITEPPPPLPPCDGENCHGIPEATPSLLSGGSATFNGEGNVAAATTGTSKSKVRSRAEELAKALRSCKSKKARKKRRTCEAQARAKYGPKARAKKSDRRAK